MPGSTDARRPDRIALAGPATAAALALALLPPPALAGQTAPDRPGWRLEVGAGAGLPAGGLADGLDAGPALGVALRRGLGPRVDLRVDVSADFLDAEEPDAVIADPESLAEIAIFPPVEPRDLGLWHARLGADVQLLPPGASPFRLAVTGGFGATAVDLEGPAAWRGPVVLSDGTELLAPPVIPVPPPVAGLEEGTEFSTLAGLALGLRLAPGVDAWARWRWNWVLADEAWSTLPVGAGITLEL